ncbi:hypothetical protein BHC43_00520 [Snodgrassella alvi]|nr:hypothetical protein BHC43_00520 [Snodgrassella alvi]
MDGEPQYLIWMPRSESRGEKKSGGKGTSDSSKQSQTKVNSHSHPALKMVINGNLRTILI